MRVLVVHDLGSLTGGAETQVLRQIEGLRLRGHEVRAVVGDQPGEVQSFGDFGFPLPGISLSRLAMLHNSRAASAVREAVRDFQPDVIHFHTMTGASATALRGLPRVVRVVTLHDYSVLSPILRKVMDRRDFCGIGDFPCCPSHAGARYYFEYLRTMLHRHELHRIDALVTPSNYLAGVASALGLRNVVVVPGSTGSPASQSVTKGREIVFVGRLEPEKGVIELLREFALLSSRLADVRLVIAGTGALEEQVRRIASGLPNRIDVLGQVTSAHAGALFAKAAIAAVPSLWAEPFGLVGPEAMAYGTPVVASSRGGIAEWLRPGSNGLHADPSRPGAMATAFERLMVDPHLWHHCSEGALSTASRFTSAEHAANLETLYLRLTTASPQPLPAVVSP